MLIKGVILAGGHGQRFWPVSRKERPKQFLSISAEGESLIQATAGRIERIIPRSDIMVVCSVNHRELVQSHLPGIKVVCEPVPRNTAAANGLAALHVLREDSDGVIVSFPSDHYIENEELFAEVVREGVKLAASKDILVALGISPASPDTAYGYIKKGSHIDGRSYQIDQFVEKPDRERAERYLSSGQYLWNGGIFIWRASALLKAIERNMPELFNGLMEIKGTLGSDAEAERTQRVFSALKGISVDYGILEHESRCAVVETGPIGWNDVGSWDAWARHFPRDDSENTVNGDVLAVESTGNIVSAREGMIALLGCKDLVVVEDGGAVLICPRSRVQDVKMVVERLKKTGRDDLI